MDSVQKALDKRAAERRRYVVEFLTEMESFDKLIRQLEGCEARLQTLQGAFSRVDSEGRSALGKVGSKTAPTLDHALTALASVIRNAGPFALDQLNDAYADLREGK